MIKAIIKNSTESSELIFDTIEITEVAYMTSADVAVYTNGTSPML